MDYPLVSMNRILLRPGHIVTKYILTHSALNLDEITLQNEVNLESVHVTSDQAIDAIDPIKRGCLFSYEQPKNCTLKGHKKYTQV